MNICKNKYMSKIILNIKYPKFWQVFISKALNIFLILLFSIVLISMVIIQDHN